MKFALAGSVAAVLPAAVKPALARQPGTKPIPSTGEQMPMIGLGSWITFNVGNDQTLKDESAAVIEAFLQGGGRMIDSSPMYGSAQATIGYGLSKLGGTHGYPAGVFSADKVWISNPAKGTAQIERSRTRWGVKRFDLMQVHNLLAWEEHLETLFEMKRQKRLRYVGVTTSHGRQHRDLERIMRDHPIDFVQLTYNVFDREAEHRLLPLARERGIAVIVNRPFRRGALIRHVERHALPRWIAETGTSSWPQFLLKFIVSHPAVTCAIPATTRVDHVRENLGAAQGELVDSRMRRRMVDFVRQL